LETAVKTDSDYYQIHSLPHTASEDTAYFRSVVHQWCKIDLSLRPLLRPLSCWRKIGIHHTTNMTFQVRRNWIHSITSYGKYCS